MMGLRLAHAWASRWAWAAVILVAAGSCSRPAQNAALLPTSPILPAAQALDPAAHHGVNAGPGTARAPGSSTSRIPDTDSGSSPPLTRVDRTPSPPITCAIFPADNIWNRDISQLPVHPMSGTWTANIGRGKNLYVGFAAEYYGMQYALTSPSTPKIALTFTSDPTRWNPGPYPYTSSTPLEVGTPDQHAFMIDTTTCTLYELYKATWNAGNPQAAAAVIFPLGSDALPPDGQSTADEAGLPILPGLARWDEVLAGAIHHALRFEAASGHIDGTIGAHLWPARHDPYYSSISSPNLPPMGARMRLKLSYNISGFSPHAQVILLALQHYGMFLADIGYDWELIGTADPRWEESVIHELEQVPASQFEVVDESSLMIDPNSGQSR